MEERYVIGKNPNTKDWWVYDNETDKYVCFCDTEEDAKQYVRQECEYFIFIAPGLCRCQPKRYGNYENCDDVKCPQKKNRLKAKEIKVTMTVVLKDDADVSEIKKWEQHIDYAIDMDSYPEIDHIENVKVEVRTK